jgi:magnesium transporter
MLLDLKFSIGTLGIAVGTLVSALYGMNLKNFIEESDLGFGAVSAICFFFSIVVSMYGLAKLRKVQRVRMWGEGGMGPSGLGHLEPGRLAWSKHSRWRTDGLEPILNGPPQEKVYMRMKRLKDNTVDPRHASSPDAARRAMVTRSNDQRSSRQPDSKTNSTDQPAARTEEEVAAKAA